MDWQPIKTAPPGERVLVSDRRGIVFVARLAALRWYDDAGQMIDRPKCWMPLPEGPKGPESERPAKPEPDGPK